MTNPYEPHLFNSLNKRDLSVEGIAPRQALSAFSSTKPRRPSHRTPISRTFPETPQRSVSLFAYSGQLI